MPALGMAQDTGKIIKWLKREGEQVARGEPLIEIETDKATVEVEAVATGVLANVSAWEGDTIPVAQVIAVILAPGEFALTRPSNIIKEEPEASEQGRLAAASPIALRVAEELHIDIGQVRPRNGARVTRADVLAHVDAHVTERQRGNGGKLLPATPKARRLASKRGIDLASLRGSGPAGAILAADLPTRPGLAAHAPLSGDALEISRAWRAMADRLSVSWPNVPHFYLMREVDATRLVAWREIAQRNTDHKVTNTDLLVRIAAAAIRQHPRVNSSWNRTGVTRSPAINIGLAVAVEWGLIVPVIHNADRLSVSEIAALRGELIERANEVRLRPNDFQGGTFTISNLGMYGVDAFNAIINPPEAAILAVGRIADRVVAVGGQPAVKPMMVLTLSCDHRVIDGARGAQFLETLASMIEEPLSLVDWEDSLPAG